MAGTRRSVGPGRATAICLARRGAAVPTDRIPRGRIQELGGRFHPDGDGDDDGDEDGPWPGIAWTLSAARAWRGTARRPWPYGRDEWNLMHRK